MATATAITKTVVTNITLELSAQEAQALTDILACVGGEPSGPRGQSDNVLQALKQAGFKYTSLRDGSFPFVVGARSLIFKDHALSDPWGIDEMDIEPPF
jgi:hypothetical protein